MGDADEVPPVCWTPPPVTGMFTVSPLRLAVSGPETAPSLFIHAAVSDGTSDWFFAGTHARGNHSSKRTNPSSRRVLCGALARKRTIAHSEVSFEINSM